MVRVPPPVPMAPVLVQVKVGWAALGEGWAVFGRSRAEALALYEEAERRHVEILARPVPAPMSEPLDDADGMCPHCVTPWKCNGPHLVDQTAWALRRTSQEAGRG